MMKLAAFRYAFSALTTNMTMTMSRLRKCDNDNEYLKEFRAFVHQLLAIV